VKTPHRPNRVGFRLVTAVLGGLGAGSGVAFLSNAIVYAPASAHGAASWMFGFWGLVLGALAGVVLGGLVLASGTTRARGLGLAVAASGLALAGLSSAWWIIMWGLPPLTAEGSWLYATAIGTLLAAAHLGLAARRSSHKGTSWVEPNEPVEDGSRYAAGDKRGT
jgi:hypothetical protein